MTGKCGAVLSYGNALHPSAVTNNSATGKNYTYDNNGNMLNRGIQSMTWNIDNRVTSITILGGGTANMEYDYAGQRMIKNATTTGMTLFPFAGYEVAPNGVITKSIRIGIETFAATKGTARYFYHNDHLGGVNVITDSAGARVQLNEYDPWGTVSRTEGSIDPTNRFTGQDLDPETGVYYYGGRYYDAEIGRFISPDPFVQDIFDPQNLNRYSYVVNNPQNYIDPDGYFHQFKKKKKKGGFFRRFFSVFMIFAGIFTLQPELLAFGTALEVAVSVTRIALSLSSIAQGMQGLVSEFVDTGGPPGIGNIGGLSPALQLAAAPGCDVFCSDATFDFWQMLSWLGPSVAHASDEGERPPPWWPPRGRPGGIISPGGKNKPIEYRPPTPGQKKHWENILKKDGPEALEKARKTTQKTLEDHYRKLAEIHQRGGYPNRVEQTILRQQNDLTIINDLLSKGP